MKGRMMKKARQFKQLSYTERVALAVYFSQGFSDSKISRITGRARSTIARERTRGSAQGTKCAQYDFKAAQIDADTKAHKKGRKVKLDSSTAEALTQLINRGNYSPYAAIQTAKHLGILKTAVCVQTLYNYIHKNKVLDVQSENLPYGFYTEKPTKTPFLEREKSNKTKEGMSIEDRPKEVLTRKEFGHWEGDTVYGKQGVPGVFLTLIERKTRYLVSIWLPNRCQASIVKGLNAIEKKFGTEKFYKCFKSVTFDNGTEFNNIEGIQTSYKGTHKRIRNIYFAHPYCSSERGSNEVVHKFIRRKYPKGKPLDNIDSLEYARHVDWINYYPRKLHNGECAAALYELELKNL